MINARSIKQTKCFSIIGEHRSTFVKVSELEFDGNNAYCISSTDPTYYRGKVYFIPDFVEVIPTLRGNA